MFQRGRYRVRLASCGADIQAAQRLRHLCFRGEDQASALDQDDFDDICRHVLIEDQRQERLVCCYRVLPIKDGTEIERSYSAKFYELSALQDFDGQILEMGRFCIHPDVLDPDILRLAWAALTRIVDQDGVKMMIGCASFHGTEAHEYLDSFAMLQERHLAPNRWLPRVKAPNVFRFAQRRTSNPDRKRGLSKMPPLLRSYLGMGGWVSDHAVVDRDLNTLHVFTGLEINRIPPARARLLRAVAGSGVSAA